jgi:glycosyltransferase involved in cell wall biosynthesis
MKVLLISAAYPPSPGGVADYTYHLAHAVAELGHEVRVVTSAVPVPRPHADESTVTVSRVVRRWSLRGLRSIVDMVRAYRPEVVSLQYVPTMYGRGGVAPGIALLPFSLRQVSRARVVAVLHELAVGWSPVPRYTLQAVAHRAQLILLGRGCHRFIVTNQRYAERLSRWVGGRALPRVIPVGANILPIPTGDDDRDQAWCQQGGAAEPLLGSLSALSIGDRPEHLIAVLQQVRPARLALLGGLPADLPRRVTVARLAQRAGVGERMIWTGYLAPDALSRTLAALDVYVHTRDVGASTRSTALAAALAHGLPIVAYRGVETASPFVDGENILLAPPDDTAALAACTARVLGSPELRRRLSAGARDLYRRHFTWHAIAQRFLEAVA